MGDMEGIQSMVSKGADVNTRSTYGSTALMLAAEKGHKECVEYLVSKGADINAKNDVNQTALDIAHSHGYQEIMKVLQNHRYKHN